MVSNDTSICRLLCFSWALSAIVLRSTGTEKFRRTQVVSRRRRYSSGKEV